MTPGDFDLNLYRGDSYAWQFRLWQDEEKTIPLDLTGATVLAQWRDKIDGTIVVTLDKDITLPNIIEIAITPALWVGAPPKGGVWDLQVTQADGQVLTPVGGSVTVTSDVSKVGP